MSRLTLSLFLMSRNFVKPKSLLCNPLTHRGHSFICSIGPVRQMAESGDSKSTVPVSQAGKSIIPERSWWWTEEDQADVQFGKSLGINWKTHRFCQMCVRLYPRSEFDDPGYTSKRCLCKSCDDQYGNNRLMKDAFAELKASGFKGDMREKALSIVAPGRPIHSIRVCLDQYERFKRWGEVAYCKYQPPAR